MAYKYLSRDVLAGFDKYKYNAVDTSPISIYLTHPFWNWVVEFYPKWIAPNVLTFSGFLLLVLQFGILTFYDYSFYASADSYPSYPAVPNVVWLLSAICLFAAHTLDGTDGKQARRTKSSGPLGELFDHGLDSLATLFMPVGMYSIFGRAEYAVETEFFFFIELGVMFTFITSHWEKYNTGVLFLPWGYDISQMAMTAMYLITYIGGYRMWKFTAWPFDITSGEILVSIMFVSIIAFSVPMSVYNIYASYRDKSGNNLSLWEGSRPLVPALLLFFLLTLWAFTSPFGIIRKQPRVFYVVTGMVFSNITCRLIVSCMSHTRCQAYNWLLTPLIAIVIGVQTLNLGVIEVYLLFAYTIIATAAHLHYGICVVNQLADHFNIHVFVIKKPEKAHNQNGVSSKPDKE